MIVEILINIGMFFAGYFICCLMTASKIDSIYEECNERIGELQEMLYEVKNGVKKWMKLM